MCGLYSRIAESINSRKLTHLIVAKRPSRKLGRRGRARFRLVASFRRSSTERGGMFFAWGMHQRWPIVLVVTALAALLVSGCGGGDDAGQEDSVEDTTTTEDTEQATTTADSGQVPVDALNAALEKSFEESVGVGDIGP